MSYWKFHDVMPHGVDRFDNRNQAVSLLNDRFRQLGRADALELGRPSLEATGELCVMVTRHLPRPPKGQRPWGKHWDLRVARTYKRTVVWFRAYDEDQGNGEVVAVGDAGKGRGWAERMVVLFDEAVKAWTAWRDQNGWPA